jgi:hypothetical protein
VLNPVDNAARFRHEAIVRVARIPGEGAMQVEIRKGSERRPSFSSASLWNQTLTADTIQNIEALLAPALEEGGLATPAAMAVFSTFIRAKTPSFASGAEVK